MDSATVFLALENMGKDTTILSLSILFLILSRKIIVSKNSDGHFESAILNRKADISMSNGPFRVVDTTWLPQNENVFLNGWI